MGQKFLYLFILTAFLNLNSLSIEDARKQTVVSCVLDQNELLAPKKYTPPHLRNRPRPRWDSEKVDRVLRFINKIKREFGATDLEVDEFLGPQVHFIFEAGHPQSQIKRAHDAVKEGMPFLINYTNKDYNSVTTHQIEKKEKWIYRTKRKSNKITISPKRCLAVLFLPTFRSYSPTSSTENNFFICDSE